MVHVLLALLLGDPDLETSLTDLAARLDTPYPSIHREIERAEAASRPAPPPLQFSWADAAAATWEVYAEAAQAPRRWRDARRRRAPAGAVDFES